MFELPGGLKGVGFDNGCRDPAFTESVSCATSNSDNFCLCTEASLSTALIDDQFHVSVSTGEEQNILFDL